MADEQRKCDVCGAPTEGRRKTCGLACLRAWRKWPVEERRASLTPVDRERINASLSREWVRELREATERLRAAGKLPALEG